jgi:hypothetical protein
VLTCSTVSRSNAKVVPAVTAKGASQRKSLFWTRRGAVKMASCSLAMRPAHWPSDRNAHGSVLEELCCSVCEGFCCSVCEGACCARLARGIKIRTTREIRTQTRAGWLTLWMDCMERNLSPNISARERPVKHRRADFFVGYATLLAGLHRECNSFPGHAPPPPGSSFNPLRMRFLPCPHVLSRLIEDSNIVLSSNLTR